MRRQQNRGGATRPTGDLSSRVFRQLGDLALDRLDAPEAERASMWWRLQNALRRAREGERLPPNVIQFLGRTLGFTTLTSELHGLVFRPAPVQAERRSRFLELVRSGVPLQELVGEFPGELTDYGVLSRRAITNNGVGFLVDAWQNLVELEAMIYHGIGTGTTAAAQTDTALETESTTALNPDNTRATGSQAENGSNVFRTIGTNTVDASVACTEHGILSQAATGGGTLWDRHTFTVINLSNGDSIQTTYDMTATAGG